MVFNCFLMFSEQEKTLTLVGGVLFLVFAASSTVNVVKNYV